MTRTSKTKSMRLFTYGRYLFAFTFPLLVGTASAGFLDEPLTDTNNPLPQIDEVKFAESDAGKDADDENSSEKLVLVSEVIIQGLENHPDQRRLEDAAYDAMSIRPGSRVTRSEVENDL